ncbi:ABC transporter ATP-binding protein [Butyrivibrio proteoclasticus B316]|uniref:ABC transporter ATP-binding protein n=1 Tax=Butyrivibrio proteoclasticus (strain ATCC 51982 / DSM 14932 / B316) TaxID=515622 RepID=E0RVF2_BUTPB|nr:ABC transporter ATP-binding protein [Butyrivibrio proteoclasticus]ADL34801.1 ABC transporter ATP-binding protein [Butyrivibrio proteoclasticus B316]
MNEVIIEFNDLGFQYRAQAKPTLYNINLKIRKGEKILIAGPSGCGKSTMASLINGLIPFSYKGEISGSLLIKGKESREMSMFDISHIVGTVLQDSDAQFVGMTVAEDLAFALENDCIPQGEMKDRVEEVAEILKLKSVLRHAPSELSGGQKQRVSVGGVMASDVDLFLFDEPLANLDPKTGKQAIELIDKLQKRTGAAVVIIEHRLEDVLHRPVDRIVLMNEGRIVSDTTPDELLASENLASCGVREPLYLTALKYSGVDIKAEMNPSSLDDLTLSEGDVAKVRSFFDKNSKEKENSESQELLTVRDLSFTYEKTNKKTLHDISASIKKGEMLAIVGTNGAGKSTFSKVVCGMEKEDSGEIVFDGLDFRTLSIKERAEHAGYVMQNPNQMISKVMIFDEVAMGLRLRGVPEDEVRSRVEKALEICGLYKMRNWPISALSYGQKKRVTICSILVLEPELMILDEPTAGQDYRNYTRIMEFLKSLNDRGITIVMITHDMHLMLEYADRSIVFNDGRIIADKSCAEVLTDRNIVDKASLKETSLYHLAQMCDIEDGTGFVQSFIDYEREHVRK